MENRIKQVTFLGQERQLLGMVPKLGVKAPEFSGVQDSLDNFSSNSLNGTLRIISVVPSVDTSVCAMQTKRFNEEIKQLDDVKVVTISCDTPFALARFISSQDIENMIAVSDSIHLSFGMKYGMVMDGVRLLARGVYIIDKNDDLVYGQIAPNVHDDIDFDEVFDFIKTIR